MPERDLATLRDECRRFVDESDREMDRLGVDRLDLDDRGRRYFVHAYGKSPAVQRFLFSELMGQIARAALGDDVYLFNEQYVVKGAERGMKFGWHQDSGFIDAHAPYLTCWIALDDANQENGTVHLLPYSRVGTRGCRTVGAFTARRRRARADDCCPHDRADVSIKPAPRLERPVASATVRRPLRAHATGPRLAGAGTPIAPDLEA